MTEWQPIETAPKDGYSFLCYELGFEDCENFKPEDSMEVVSWDKDSKCFRQWGTCNRIKKGYWMPLPKPPKEKDE